MEKRFDNQYGLVDVKEYFDSEKGTFCDMSNAETEEFIFEINKPLN